MFFCCQKFPFLRTWSRNFIKLKSKSFLSYDLQIKNLISFLSYQITSDFSWFWWLLFVMYFHGGRCHFCFLCLLCLKMPMWKHSVFLSSWNLSETGSQDDQNCPHGSVSGRNPMINRWSVAEMTTMIARKQTSHFCNLFFLIMQGIHIDKKIAMQWRGYPQKYTTGSACLHTVSLEKNIQRTPINKFSTNIVVCFGIMSANMQQNKAKEQLHCTLVQLSFCVMLTKLKTVLPVAKDQEEEPEPKAEVKKKKKKKKNQKKPSAGN